MIGRKTSLFSSKKMFETIGSVYILRSLTKTGTRHETYTGATKRDVHIRLSDYNSENNKTKSTKRHGPYVLAAWVENVQHPFKLEYAVKHAKLGTPVQTSSYTHRKIDRLIRLLRSPEWTSTHESPRFFVTHDFPSDNLKMLPKHITVTQIDNESTLKRKNPEPKETFESNKRHKFTTLDVWLGESFLLRDFREIIIGYITPRVPVFRPQNQAYLRNDHNGWVSSIIDASVGELYAHKFTILLTYKQPPYTHSVVGFKKSSALPDRRKDLFDANIIRISTIGYTDNEQYRDVSMNSDYWITNWPARLRQATTLRIGFECDIDRGNVYIYVNDNSLGPIFSNVPNLQDYYPFVELFDVDATATFEPFSDRLLHP